jgi:hypothetical protein
MFKTTTKGKSQNTSSELEYSKKSESKHPHKVNTSTYGEIPVYPQSKDIAQDIEKLKQTYDFDLEQKEEIENFLRENQEVIQVLQEAKDQIKKCFPNETLYIEYEDGEEYEDGGELFLSIETRKDVKGALESLRNLKKGWWTDRRIKINSKLSIDVRFIK